MLGRIKEILWGTPTAVIIMLVGAYFTFALLRRGAFGKKSMVAAIRSYGSGSGDGISPFASLATALGGTVGIGSITGVGIALSVGGAGSMLWFWLCGLLCGGIKYAEVVAASCSKVRMNGVFVGGAMYSLKAGGHKAAAVIFSVCGILASFGTGNMTQASAVGDVMAANGIPRTVSAALLAVLVAFAVFGGQKRIAGVSAAIVPAAGAVYLALALFMLIRGAHELPRVFGDIFAAAFGLRQAVGGTLGISVSTAISVGLTRCIFSNEAGMGTSPMAHSSAENVLPSVQGLMGAAEIIADTFVFSTVTALALLCHGTTDVYELFTGKCGMFGRIVLPVLLVIFAYAAIIAWCYYAESCISFLFPHSCGAALTVYRLLSVACVFVGVMVVSQSVWDIADILNVFMMIPNIFDLIIKRKEILRWIGTK